MAHVTRTRPKSGPFLDQGPGLAFGFQADAMAGPATLETLHLGHWLPVKIGHGFHRAPRQSVLSISELFNLGSVAVCADFRTREPCIAGVAHGVVPFAMA